MYTGNVHGPSASGHQFPHFEKYYGGHTGWYRRVSIYMEVSRRGKKGNASCGGAALRKIGGASLESLCPLTFDMAATGCFIHNGKAVSLHMAHFHHMVQYRQIEFFRLKGLRQSGPHAFG